MKHEWRKKEKQIYIPPQVPEVIDIPEFKFISIEGEGNPNGLFFSECITALYSIAYAIKMNLKKAIDKPVNYCDFTVYPLEGVWDLNEEGRKNYKGEINKDNLVFDLMLRQPHFVSDDFFDQMLDLTKAKKGNPLLDRVKFKSFTEGPCIQMMHVGSYDDEPASFEKMENFAKDQSRVRKSKIHREIYLSDFRKVAKEKLKTVLRFQLDDPGPS